MKNILSFKITAIILAVLALVSLFFYANMLATPLTYGFAYYHASMYEGDDFGGTMTFYQDNTLLVDNSNFDEPLKLFYYYKDGYVFILMATTEEEFDAEVAMINENFEEAISTPFYADKANAFLLTAEGMEEYTSFYYCRYSINLAIAWGIGQLALIGLAWASIVGCKKAKH